MEFLFHRAVSGATGTLLRCGNVAPSRLSSRKDSRCPVPASLAPRDLLLVLAVVTIWGFAFVPMRWALDSVPPFALAALRFLFAAVPALFFIRRPDVPWSTLVIYGFAIGVFQFGLLFLGMKLGMPAGLSSLVIQTQVFFTIGLAAWWLHDRLDRHSLIGAAIAAAGIAVLAWHKFAAGATATLLGFLLVLGAALAWAVGNIVAKAAAARPRAAAARRRRAAAAARRARAAASTAPVPPTQETAVRREPRHARPRHLVEPHGAAAAGARLVVLRGRTRGVGRRGADGLEDLGVRALHELLRDAVRTRALERAAASLPDRRHRAVRTAHSRLRTR